MEAAPPHDASIKANSGKILKTPFRSPNLQAFVERFHQTLRREVLDHFILFGQKHLDYLTTMFTTSYHTHRPHQAKDNAPLVLPRSKAKKVQSKSVTGPPRSPSLTWAAKANLAGC